MDASQSLNPGSSTSVCAPMYRYTPVKNMKTASLLFVVIYLLSRFFHPIYHLVEPANLSLLFVDLVFESLAVIV